MQLNHYTSKFKKKKLPIILVCDNITNAPNIGSLFRAADAFGIERIIFCGNNISMGKRMTKTSRATEKYVDYTIEKEIKFIIEDFKRNNYYLIALEITKNSQPLSSFQLNSNKPIVLILGDENFGVSNFILSQVDAILHIDMFGQNSSMNVTHATSIALYEMTKQLNQIL
ncbi:TrmH family RNA methyltransferase [Winogradskyella ursingii]|uniref:TrmH family RNA methyltransferase n=1 Tax=Winogradskyella ursingii TaxID=2686079 RepID=UPI0015CDD7E8|nr:TrmH family RNA methyltransferase [Winogradskyella ursingii]